MPATLSITLRGGDALGKRFQEMSGRLSDLRPCGAAVVGVMRQGPGSVGEQFEQQSENSMAGRFPWLRTRDFGRRLAPVKTLHDKGKLESGWTGGLGSTTTVTQNSFAVGVDSSFPQARVFQSKGPTIVRPKKMGKRGRYKMGWYLGLQFGVWLSNARLLQGLVIQPRRVAINETMLARVRDKITRFAVTGQVAA